MLFGAEHVRRYRETDGDEGHDWQGTHTLILTTTGRKSGEPRSTPLIYGRSGDDYVVVASKGGSDDPPAWYLNREADPQAEIRVKADRLPVRSRVAATDDKPGLWTTMTAEWPADDEYQQKTDPEIPVVVLSRA